MTSRADPQVDLEDLARRLTGTVLREHMSVAEATQYQHDFVDCVRGTPVPSQVRDRPPYTAWAERVLARFFGADDAVLVQGAGTGAIRAMLNAAVSPGTEVLVHAAPAYRTTEAAMRHMGIKVRRVDFNTIDLEAVLATAVEAVHIQHAPQRLGDTYEVTELISMIRAKRPRMPVLVDEHGVVMRAHRIGTQLGATASAFSLMKLLARANIGCVLGPEDLARSIRRDLSSQGCQVRADDAIDAVHAMSDAPVALAMQNETVIETVLRLNDLVQSGRLPGVFRAIACQPVVRSVVLLLTEPAADDLLPRIRSTLSDEGWVAEESRYSVGPIFSGMSSTFSKECPDLARYTIRINPMRSGPDTILRAVVRVLSS